MASREERIRELFGTMSTEQQETLTSARGAIDRIQARATALQERLTREGVSDAAASEIEAGVAALKNDADAAQQAFDAIGVESPAPVEPTEPTEPGEDTGGTEPGTDTPVGRRRGR